jgi:hypothetical protein
MRWSRCRETAYARELHSLARLLNHHAEICRGDRDCPLNALESVLARQIVMHWQNRPEIIPWPTSR